jgi:hypothetical protein
MSREALAIDAVQQYRQRHFDHRMRAVDLVAYRSGSA